MQRDAIWTWILDMTFWFTLLESIVCEFQALKVGVEYDRNGDPLAYSERCEITFSNATGVSQPDQRLAANTHRQPVYVYGAHGSAVYTQGHGSHSDREVSLAIP